MNEKNYGKFRQSLIERRAEIRLDINRTERRLADLQSELAGTQTAIDNIDRDRLRRNDKY